MTEAKMFGPIDRREPDPQVGFRCPRDLHAALVQACAKLGVKQTAIIVAALRRHLNVPDPAYAKIDQQELLIKAREAL